MDGRSLTPILKKDAPIREAALFGVHGGHVNVTDGRYVYMHACAEPSNQPLYDYTLMPMHMNAPFNQKSFPTSALPMSLHLQGGNGDESSSKNYSKPLLVWHNAF